MKKNLSLLIAIAISTFADAKSQSEKSKNSIQVIVSGSGCPQKQTKPADLLIEADQATVPLDFEIQASGPSLQRKTCQARLTIIGEPGFHYEIREVSQNLLFTVSKKSEMKAEISFGLIGQQEFKIDQDVKVAGEYRHILVKKLINYATACGKDAVLRIQTDIQSTGGEKNSFKSEALALHIEKRSCKSANE